jgi:hypothetical protein
LVSGDVARLAAAVAGAYESAVVGSNAGEAAEVRGLWDSRTAVRIGKRTMRRSAETESE